MQIVYRAMNIPSAHLLKIANINRAIFQHKHNRKSLNRCLIHKNFLCVLLFLFLSLFAFLFTENSHVIICFSLLFIQQLRHCVWFAIVECGTVEDQQCLVVVCVQQMVVETAQHAFNLSYKIHSVHFLLTLFLRCIVYVACYSCRFPPVAVYFVFVLAWSMSWLSGYTDARKRLYLAAGTICYCFACTRNNKNIKNAHFRMVDFMKKSLWL